MTRVWSEIGVRWLLLLTVLPLAADPVAVGDPGFEGNSLGPGQWDYNLEPEWKETNGPGSGSGFEEFIGGFSAEGTDHLGMTQGHQVWQDLGVVYQANTRYTLTVAAGNRVGGTDPGNVSTYALADSTGEVHAVAGANAALIAPGSFADLPPLVLDTTGAPAAVGRTIRVLLRADGSGRSHFDNIRLDALPLQLPGAATIVVSPATGIGAGEAELHAEVTDIGDAEPAVTFFYGTADGGPDPAGWEHSVALAGTHGGPVSTPIGGLSPATLYYFGARATNSAGDSWALPSGSFETLALPPAVDNLAATGIGATTATLGATVVDNGGDNPQVTIYHGTVDGGTDPAAWQSSVALGSVAGAASVTVTGLAPATGYHFRAHAENSGGSGWAPSTAGFSTVTVTLPGIRNREPEGITGTTASLRGEVTSTGADVPSVTVFYGPVDGETNAGAWAGSAEVGPQDGDFSIFVPGLLPDTNYWFRCRAVNAAGTAWSADSDFFRTSGLVPSGVVINEIHYDPRDESTPGEFIELHNPGDVGIDISGWRLGDAVDFTFPAGTTIAGGGYLVVAEDPATVLAIHGVQALGPWTGRLDNDGEQIDLRDDTGAIHDQVSYDAGFPWPTAARGGGASAELVHPALDNELGGSWRPSTAAVGEPGITYVAAASDGWRYRKGTSEPAGAAGEWRLTGYTEDASWLPGRTPIGYGDGDDNTVLGDMSRNYSTVYLRHEFILLPEEVPDTLTLRVYCDDGAVVWINGTEVARLHAPDGELAHDALGINHEAAWEDVTIASPGLFLVGGTNVLAVHALNTTIRSSDFSIDAELLKPGVAAGSTEPSPGERNRSFSTTAPPQIRQVGHSPRSPVSGDPVTVTAKITDPDGIGPVSLAYQLVDPGAYVRRTDAGYASGWTSVPMVDDGSGGDVVAGDYVFTAVLPGDLQVHRRLVRYRIAFEDAAGTTGGAPWPDDEQPNFAYFVDDGPAAWSGSFTGTGEASTFGPELLDDLPVYHLVANETDVLNCQYNGNFDGVHMTGTLVYDGEVYDHIEFENRGEASTYVSGKNKWRFHFNRARGFKARDTWGRRYQSDWNRMNFDACSSPWAAVHRGSAGVEEALSYRLYELCGVPSPRTHYVHFRVVDRAGEVDAGSQYEGDLWGLYLAIEQPDGSFLNDRGLPDGNVYKIEGGGGDKKEQGLGQPVDSSDWNAFYSASGSAQDESWWRANLQMETYYSFRSCNRISGNVDLREGYNHYYYHHPDGHWYPMPWDLDMMFIAETHWPGHIRALRSIVDHPVLALEFRNRARELLDLMCSDDSPAGGQIGQLIDEYAQIVNPAGQALTWADLDANLWNYHPRTRGDPNNHGGQTNHKGNFYYTPFRDSRMGGDWTRILASPDHEGSMNYLRDYATDTFGGGTWQVGNGVQQGYGYEFLASEAADPGIPERPLIVYSGGAGFPVDELVFHSSEFADPQGPATFAAMRWRLAEIAGPGRPGYTAGTPRRYEVETGWDSGELAAFQPTIQIPVAQVRPGHTYRVRVRHKDTSNRWSHWSEPVEFVAGSADLGPWVNNLVVSEFMYNPPDPEGVDELAASTENDDFEFIELRNVSPDETLDLTDLRFTKGVDFEFAGGAVTSLAPGAFVLVVKNLAAFEARDGPGLPVAGEFSGNLSNGGEQLRLAYGAGDPIRDFTYGDLSPWPAEADGGGPSLVLVEPETVPDHTQPSNWRAGGVAGGTPGADEPPPPGSFEEWQLAHFTPADRLEPDVSGEDADPEGDGSSNLLEFALATDPWAVDVPRVRFAWVDLEGGAHAAIRFEKPALTSGLVYELLAGSDLGGWEPVPGGPLSEGPLGDGIEQAVLVDGQPGTLPRRFLRIRVHLSE